MVNKYGDSGIYNLPEIIPDDIVEEVFPAVSARALSIGYPRSVSCAVNAADFSIPRGGVCWLLGHNGSGKSSLGLALAGMLPGIVPGIRKGYLRVHGRDPAMLTPLERIELSGFILQDPSSQLCTLTVESEIALLLENKNECREEISRRTSLILDQFGISHLANRDILTLSGGEKQLVALASTALAPPQVLVLDEPCAYLDDRNRKLVLQIVSRMKNEIPGMTLIIIEHRTDGLPASDCILLLNSEGKVTSVNESVEWDRDFPTISGRKTDGNPVVLRITDLHFRYSGKPYLPLLLNGLNLTVHRGEITVLKGINGSGKSTLLHLIAGALCERVKSGLKAESGTIEFIPSADQDIHETPIMLVPQNPEHLFISSSVQAELFTACKGNEETICEVMKRFDLMELNDRNPYTLSTGQKRRLNLAVASVIPAQIVLMDEPTFGLDSPGVCELIRLMEQLRDQGKTLLVATHDDSFSRAVADTILILDRGVLRNKEDSVEMDESGSKGLETGTGKKGITACRSPFSRLNPLARGAGVMIFILGVSFSGSLQITLSWLVPGLLSALCFTSLHPSVLLRKMFPFALIGAGFLWANLLFHRNGGFADGFTIGLLLFFRSLVFGVFSLLFVQDMDPEEFAHSLLHYLKVPPKLVYSTLIAFRLGPELKSELSTISFAVDLREINVNKRRILNKIGRTFHIFFAVFVSAFRRAGRIAVALEGRGLDNGPRSMRSVPAFSWMDIMFLVVCILLFTAPLIVLGTNIWQGGYF